jgi:hypothetical protein
VQRYINKEKYTQELLDCPLIKWVHKLETIDQKDCIEDVSNFTMAFNDLKALNCGILGETGMLPARYASDLRMINP